jgi:distribution and morphology protein 12
MSVDVDWSKLDDSLAEKVKEFLNEHFKKITKPSFIGEVQVVNFDWGTEPPQIEITHITEPFDEFYADDLEDVQPASSQDAESMPTLAREMTSSANSYIAASKTESTVGPSQWNGNTPYYSSTPGSNENNAAYEEANIFNTSISISQQELPNGNQFPTSTPAFNAYLLNSFHRSPLVAPHHPFSSHHHQSYFSPTQSAPMSPKLSHTTPRPSSSLPTTNMDSHHSVISAGTMDPSMYRSDGMTNPGSTLDLQDWIDDVEIPRGISIAPSGSQAALNDAAAEDEAKLKLEESKTESDFQVHFSVSYKGDMAMTILTELRMNYPSVMFMSLPMQLRVTAIEFEATAVIAYLKGMNRVCISVLEPEDLELEGIPTTVRDFGR